MPTLLLVAAPQKANPKLSHKELYKRFNILIENKMKIERKHKHSGTRHFPVFLVIIVFLISVSFQPPEESPADNTPPRLTGVSLNPKEGNEENPFEYSITYKDEDNELPTIHKIHIDDIAHEMKAKDEQDSNCVDGKEYSFVTKLEAGEHTYSFEFSDGKTAVNTSLLKGPVVKALEKPAEKKTNQKPAVDLYFPYLATEVSPPVNLVWNGWDRDGDELTYTLYIDTSRWFENPIIVPNLNSTSFSAQNLSRGKTYYWKVIPNDGKDNGTCDRIGYFFVKKEVIPNKPPVPKVEITPANPKKGQTITFDGRGSEDPDGRIVSYYWVFGDGAISREPFTTHIYTQGRRNFFVQLTVADNQGVANVWGGQIYVGGSIVSELEPRLINMLASAIGPCIGALLVATFGYIWITRRRRRFSKLEKRVIGFYKENRNNYEMLKDGLEDLKKLIKRRYAEGKIDRVQFDTLFDLINGYLKGRE